MNAFYPGNDLNLGSIDGLGDHLTLRRQDRARHTCLWGSTRSGKTMLMQHMARLDLAAWAMHRCPVVALDPHGTFYDGLLAFAATNFSRLPLVPIDLRRGDLVVSYNLLRRREGVDPAVTVRNVVLTLLHNWGQSNTNETPRLATWLETLLMLAYERECTLTEALQLIREPDLRSVIRGEVEHLVARSTLASAERLREAEFQDRVESTLYRINRFLGTQLLRATFCQDGASLDFDRVLTEGKIVLITTSTEGTQIAEEDARTFASVVLTDLWLSARRRGKRQEGRVRPCYTYVDEFQHALTPALASGLAEASGMGLHFTLCSQSPRRILDQGESGRAVLDAVLTNAKNRFVFNLSHPDDLELLTPLVFRQHVDPDAVKSEIYATRVLGHVVSYQPSYSQGVSRGSSRGVSESVTDGESYSESDTWSHTTGTSDAESLEWSRNTSENEANATNHTRSEGSSDAHSRQASRSRSRTDTAGESDGTGEAESFGLSSRRLDREAEFDEEFDESHAARETWTKGTSTQAGTSRSTTDGSSEGSAESQTLARSSGTADGSSLSRGRTSGKGHGGSKSHGSITSDTTGGSITRGVSSSRMKGTNRSVNLSLSRSVSYSPLVLPILGRELASRTFRSVAEQLFSFAQAIDALPDRQCYVRLASQPRAVRLLTDPLAEPLVTAERLRRCVDATLRKLPFVVPIAEALANLRRREARFAADVLGFVAGTVEEPEAGFGPPHAPPDHRGGGNGRA